MKQHNFYIHGTPYGHQIWGSQVNHDYIGTFYNHDSKSTDNVLLQIDIYRGDTYYTYLRQNNVYDAGGRPNAFFAMTVSFSKSYCSNVYRLYQLFEAIYKQICIGKLLKENNSQIHYIIRDFESASAGTHTVVSNIQNIFNQKAEGMLEPFILPLSSYADTYNKAKRSFSLMEVDSPYFFDLMKKSSLIVSPDIEPSATVLQGVSKTLQNISSQKTALETSNAQLKATVATLSDDNKSLSQQLANATSSADKKHKNTISKLQNDLYKVTEERDFFKRKIDEVSSSIELIDKPLKTLTRLMAGRFPECNQEKHEYCNGNAQKISQKHPHPSWYRWINRILLICIFILCGVNLYYLTQHGSVNPSNEIKAAQEATGRYDISPAKTVQNETDSTQTYNEGYDNWSQCFINIINGGDTVHRGQNYPLKICRKGTQEEAHVPNGCFNVTAGNTNDGSITIEDNNLKISSNYNPGTSIIIKYSVNNETKIQRSIKILK